MGAQPLGMGRRVQEGDAMNPEAFTCANCQRVKPFADARHSITHPGTKEECYFCGDCISVANLIAPRLDMVAATAAVKEALSEIPKLARLRDIVVSTPKTRMKEAVEEAERAIALDGVERTYYFRNLGKHGGANLGKGSRVYYVEDGYVRGFGVVEDDEDVLYRDYEECDATGREYGAGWYAYIPADSWQWIRPIPHKGFQGWRYAPAEWREVEIIGGWLDPKP